jgi:hypothetical protein
MPGTRLHVAGVVDVQVAPVKSFCRCCFRACESCEGAACCKTVFGCDLRRVTGMMMYAVLLGFAAGRRSTLPDTAEPWCHMHTYSQPAAWHTLFTNLQLALPTSSYPMHHMAACLPVVP